jgi:hypothetical protein
MTPEETAAATKAENIKLAKQGAIIIIAIVAALWISQKIS